MIIILLGAINQCNGHSYYTKYYKYYTRVPKRTLYLLDDSRYHVLVDASDAETGGAAVALLRAWLDMSRKQLDGTMNGTDL